MTTKVAYATDLDTELFHSYMNSSPLLAPPSSRADCRSRLLDRCPACEDLATPSGLQLQGGFVLKTDGFRRRRLPSRPAGRGPRATAYGRAPRD